MAYRDGVLSPAETSDLHKRIKQSEVAGNLLRRIESVIQRRNLLAPKMDGDGLGGDPNTVAEYLDDALAGSQVPEFERICIVESDVQLAELAHCHQLLADAMHTQVRVPQHLKAMIAGLPKSENRIALEERLLRPVDTVEAVEVLDVPKVAASNADSADHDPSKLRTSNRSWLTPGSHPSDTAPTGAQNRRIDQPHAPVVAAVASDSAPERPQVQAPMVTSGGGSIKPRGLDLEGSHLAHEIPEYLIGAGRDGWRMPLAISAMVALLALLIWQSLGPLENVRQLFDPRNSLANRTEASTNKNEATRDSRPASPKIIEPLSAKNNLPRESNRQESVPPAASNNTNVVADIPTKAAPTAPAVVNPAPGSGSPDIVVAPTPPSVDAIDPPAAIRWSPSNADEHRAVLLARQLTPDGNLSLIRVSPSVALPETSEIVVPPAVRATLDLAGNCQWTVCGPTLLQGMGIAQGTGSDVASVASPLCRALVRAREIGNRLAISSPAGSTEMQFQDAESMAAVEVVYRPVSSGLLTDPGAYKPLLIVVIVEGEIVINYQDQTQLKVQTLTVGDGLALIDGAPRLFKLGEIPDWYRGNSTRAVDAQAAMDLHELLPEQVEIGNSLVSICGNRRSETAALAIQTSLLLGDWNPLANGFLANESMRNHWNSTIDLAEQVVASSADQATALKQSLVAVDPVRGKVLFGLFEGIAEDQQPGEFIPKLIDFLESPNLDERVLAARHLRQLTGKDFGYQPHLPTKSSVQQWRRESAASRLKLKTIGDPLWEAKK
jgi:hypothetical protein